MPEENKTIQELCFEHSEAKQGNGNRTLAEIAADIEKAIPTAPIYVLADL